MLDAHIQYAPYKGVIQNQIYKPGMFHPAYIFKKGEYNEKLIHNITTSKGVMSVAQISGVIARNIERFVDEGHEIVQNQEIGLICFGSRCDLFIPLENKMEILRDIHKREKVFERCYERVQDSSMRDREKKKIRQFILDLRIGKAGKKVKVRRLTSYLQYLLKFQGNKVFHLNIYQNTL